MSRVVILLSFAGFRLTLHLLDHLGVPSLSGDPDVGESFAMVTGGAVCLFAHWACRSG